MALRRFALKTNIENEYRLNAPGFGVQGGGSDTTR
jgi:hypothetical protein